MCTVSFLPLPENQFLLTHNRDEKVIRENAIFPTRENGLLFPKDGLAGGTWIISSKDQKTICLLNGAFEKHDRQLPYRHSRGKVLLDAFQFDDFDRFCQEYNLDKIEPFTLILIDHSDGLSLLELRWDGSKKYIKSLDPRSTHFWCSATLYPKKMAEQRESWFEEWLSENKFDLDAIRHFHRYGGKGDESNNLTINRDDLMKTISITSIYKENGEVKMMYEDLQEESLQVEVV